MKNILVVMAHPKFEHSRIIKGMVNEIQEMPNVTIRDLYELYPDFNVKVQPEQEFLLLADLLIWMHPVYWYSAPALLKQWIDLVLEFNWAYGPRGNYLKGKLVFSAISTGGTDAAYTTNGKHGHDLADFLLPFRQTAALCGMKYLPPFHIGGTHEIEPQKIKQEALLLKSLLDSLSQTGDHSKVNLLPKLNHFNP
ncbi:NAD(P)H-dependent oxidoreductase [Cyclobacterium jeungdonense]|uniref:NAD(P)H-dependent oxidoreductase n=1 Tax=Cyclobacterium jeungdonense TaxID=708087 RepID=A0ABT8CEE3_9BACT|nr:NAD(P)H-dependent oxidoreductase [Cyclobacterium jeungdonense]MDN3689953.1 NAD(P)H-dependent oxidoreductase [Cyclobacterium jeungdonense]